MIAARKLRSTIIFLILFGAYCIIIVMLFYLQIFNSSFFLHLGKQQYTVSATVNPPRAPIYDRNNKPVAMNAECLSAFLLPRQLEQAQRTASFLQKNFPAAYRRLQTHHDRHFLYIKRRLAPYEIALIEKNGTDDIKIVKEPCRFYPFQTMGTLIGITDIDNDGLSGLELMFNQQLKGKTTTCSLERDARSGHFYFNKILHQQGSQGTPIQLTIDSDLQFLAYTELKDSMERFKAREGGVVIIDPTTGELIVSVSAPDFNPNSSKIPDPNTMKNFPFTQAFEAGSVIKTFAAMAALEAGVVTPDELIDCQNTKTGYVNGMKINTVHEDGVVTFSKVIEDSNNIGTVKVILRVGPKLYDYYRRFGFAQKTPINFPGQQAGFINHPHNWTKRSIVSLSFGYEIRVTLIQLAQAFGLIANNGRPVTLHILKNEQPKQHKQPVFSPKVLAQMREILTKTVLEGTAQHARIKGYTVMGKTGTANLIEHGRYNENKNVYTFAGIIEKGPYKRVIVTYINDVTIPHYHLYASNVTVPLFERVAEKMLIHDHMV